MPFVFCRGCGCEIHNTARACPHCGAPQNLSNEVNATWVAALLLCFFLGVFGAHRFFTGRILLGVLQLLTLGGCGIWTLIDFILLICGQLKDSNDQYIRFKQV